MCTCRRSIEQTTYFNYYHYYYYYYYYYYCYPLSTGGRLRRKSCTGVHDAQPGAAGHKHASARPQREREIKRPVHMHASPAAGIITCRKWARSIFETDRTRGGVDDATPSASNPQFPIRDALPASSSTDDALSSHVRRLRILFVGLDEDDRPQVGDGCESEE